MLPRLRGPASRRDLLAIYLADHDAAASGGIALARRAAGNVRHHGTSEQLRQLADELSHDRSVVRQLMSAIDARPAPWKVLAAQVAERAGRFKLNGRLRGYSPLSHVWEMEGLLDAIAAKRRLWQMVADLPGLESATDVDAAHMLSRADDQVDRLEPLWRSATGMAFPGVRLGADGVGDDGESPGHTSHVAP